MNNDELMNDGRQNNNTYRATTNLNMAIENPQVNIDSVVGVNIKNVSNENLMNTSNNANNFSSFPENSNFGTGFSNQLNPMNNNSSQFMNYSAVSNNYQEQNTQNISEVSNLNNNTVVSNDKNDSVEYKPTMNDKKGRNKKVRVSRELVVSIVIVLVLLIFIFMIPYIYDFIEELQLMAM